MNRKMRFGMVGGSPGAFIGKVHLSAIRLNNDADLVAGCFSRDPEKRSLAAQTYAIASDRNYESYEIMAEAESNREDKIDWVIIVTPNNLHYPIAKLFMEKGISVVCDKPLCLTVGQGLDLKQTASDNDCLFAVTYTYTGHVMTREAKRLINDGAVGEIKMILGEYPQDGLLRAYNAAKGSFPASWRFDPEQAGRGAAVADIGTHVENWVRYVTGLKITGLCCNLERFADGPPRDNNVMCMLKYDSGANGMYWVSQVAAGYANGMRVRVVGTKGTLEFVQETSNYLKLSPIDGPVQILDRGRSYIPDNINAMNRLPAGHSEGLTEAFANIYRDFSKALRDKYDGLSINQDDYGYPTIDMGIAGVEFYNKCVDSFEAGCAWVDVDMY